MCGPKEISTAHSWQASDASQVSLICENASFRSNTFVKFFFFFCVCETVCSNTDAVTSDLFYCVFSLSVVHKSLQLPGCFAFCCLPCFACKISREYGQCLCLPLLDLFWIIPPVTYGFRVSMRERYGIRDTMCRDCLLATCCRACSWCQMSKELKRRTIPIALIGAKPTA
ncbi:cornifelin homolog A-like isoform X1 [Denticeps clupeoides]|uniref:cornifelin homolog A-like isoform X1 n=1 Tax=Denticeps clupeoides TaxID=299321 RepID=UPI0010A5900C|nr:cornifelin homolog A-like isoform X1 [Denticeps clupeoides]